MARKYKIPALRTEFVTNIAAAIADYYGVGNYTIHYTDATNIIFSISSIFDKVIKIVFASDTQIAMYYGDAWTSGTTITNPITIKTDIYDTYGNALNLILAEKFMMIHINAIAFADVTIFGMLGDGRCVAFNVVNSSNSAFYNYAYGYLTTGIRVYPHFIYYPRSHSYLEDGNPILNFPLLFINATSQLLEDPTTFAPLTIAGLTTTRMLREIYFSDKYFAVSGTWYCQSGQTFIPIKYSTTFLVEIDNYTL